MIEEELINVPAHTEDFTPFPSASNRKSWESLQETSKQRILDTAKRTSDTRYPYLSASSYMEFSKSGDRVHFEKLYFEKRRKLNAAVLAQCILHDQAYLDDIVDGIYSICEETGWQLPAHNSYIRDTPQEILPDPNRPVLDLFACETGALLATLRTLLKSELDNISPLIVQRIDENLQQRIITPYLTMHFWWMGNGEEPMCNWTPWCTQNVLLAIFSLPTSEAIRHTSIAQAAYSLDCFLKDYGNDGCCNEGAQYYRHAALCLLGSLEILNAVTKGAFSSVYKEEKIRNMVSYIMRVHAQGPYFINFGDCSPLAGLCGSREYLFAKRTDNQELRNFALYQYHQDLAESRDLPQEINLTYRLLALFLEREMEESSPLPFPKGDIYFPSTGLLVSRDETYVLSVKAGGNGDSHNHNDTGSFILYKKGNPLLIDIGVESYTKRTFSPERYGIWTMQSSFHNVTNFSSFSQEAGKTFCASNVKVQLEENPTIQMELKGVYPKEAEIHSYIRQVSHRKNTGIQINDTVETASTAVLTLMSAELPKILEDKIALGNLGIIQINPWPQPGDISIEKIPITDERLRITWPDKIYRILIRYEQSISLQII
ncbi:heparinase II/III family protein [uncultured Sphaerochaeta sp.]|uniref:heparinase II/III domain-containing protein n=1 Tax=uncultured Sphaerochaeta sp. TaxID=886478 RepID=UPI002A0A2952|nr:heparinase II/III family protein [uncultured Sphaerochaeta sp.]